MIQLPAPPAMAPAAQAALLESVGD